MTEGGGAVLRSLRGGWLAGTGTALAAGAHLAGRGELPGAVTLTLVAALIAWPVALLIGRSTSQRRMLVLLLGAQAAAHAGFTLAAWWSQSSAVTFSGDTGHHGHAAMTEVSAAGCDLVLPDGPMLAAHLGAALLMWRCLSVADAALFAILALVVPVFAWLRVLWSTAFDSACGTGGPRSVRFVVPHQVSWCSHAGRHVLARRGPPLLLA